MPAVVPPTSNWAAEISCDVEWAHAIAPGAHIDLVECNSASPSDLLAGVKLARFLPGVSAVSMSWGIGAEFAEEASNDSIFSARGVTFVTSSGDYGWPAGAGSPGGPGGSLAFSPNVLTVGGTVINVDNNGNPVSETAWAGSGGGESQFQPGPPFQFIDKQFGINGERATPDVAFDAGTPVDIVDSYDSPPQTSFVGTSVGAPCWAALVAIADQGRALSGQPPLGTVDVPASPGVAPLTFANPQELMFILYDLPTTDFHQVQSGSDAQITAIQPPANTNYIATSVSFVNGPGEGAQAVAVTSGPNGVITAVNVTSGGSGYSAMQPPTAVITGEGATVQMSVTVDSGGHITGVSVPAGGVGSGFLSIDIEGGNPASGQQDSAIPTVVNGRITAITMTSAIGAGGYSSVPTVTIGGNVNGNTPLAFSIDGKPGQNQSALALAIVQPGVFYNDVTGLGTPNAKKLISDLVDSDTLDNQVGFGVQSPFTSDHGVALAAVNGINYIAFRANGTHRLIIVPMFADGSLDAADAWASGGFSSSPLPQPSITVNGSPALASLNGQLYVAWPGENDNGQLFVAKVTVTPTGGLSSTGTINPTGESGLALSLSVSTPEPVVCIRQRQPRSRWL